MNDSCVGRFAAISQVCSTEPVVSGDALPDDVASSPIVHSLGVARCFVLLHVSVFLLTFCNPLQSAQWNL